MYVLGVTLQLAALVAFFAYYKKRTFTQTGFVFLAVAFAYHSLTELFGNVSQQVWAGRSFVSINGLADWLALSGISLSFFVAMHISVDLWFSRVVKTTKSDPVPSLDTPRVPWVLFLAIGVGTLWIALSGDLWDERKFDDSALLSYLSVGLARDLLILGPALIGVGLLWKTRGNYYWLVTIPLLAITFLLGSRFLVLATGVLLIFGVSFLGLSVSWRRAVTTVVMAVALAIAISGLRMDVGRTVVVQADGPVARFALTQEFVGSRLGSIFTGAGEQKLEPSLPKDTPEPVGQRLDGNSIPSAVLVSLYEGIPPLGTNRIWFEMRSAVPTFLYQSKLTDTARDGATKEVLTERFSLTPPEFSVDYIITQGGALLAYAGVPGFLLGMALLGFLYGVADAYCHRRPGTYAMLIGLGAVACALSYEQSLYIYATTSRTIGMLLLLAIGVNWLIEQLKCSAKLGNRNRPVQIYDSES